MKSSGMTIIIMSLFFVGCFASLVSAEDTLKARIDSMFVIASSGDFKFRDLVEPTIEDMAAIGAEAVPYLIDRLGTEDSRERVTLENIFKKIGSPAVPLLNRALLETDSLQLSRVALILYYLPDSSSVENLLQAADNPYYWVRYQTVRALGKIGDMRARPAIETALGEDNELVRTMAAVSAGRIDGEAFFPQLTAALDDVYYGVRMAALEELKKLDCETKVELIPPALKGSQSKMTTRFLLAVMADDSCQYDIDMLTPYLDQADPVVRSLALKTAFRSSGKWVISEYGKRLRGSENFIVRQTIEDLIEAYEAQETPANP